MKSLRILSPNRLFKSRHLLVLLAVAALLVLAGCAETGQMIDQPRLDPLEPSTLFADGRASRSFVPGTVPYSGDQSPNSPELTGLDENGQPVSGFPVSVDEKLLATGQERFGIYCTPCHGQTGEGNGKVTTFGYPKPPSLLADNAKGLTAGQIFGIITNGQGNMYSYAYRVKPAERWAVIAYIRAMQLKNGTVNLQELTPAEIDQIGKQP